METRKILWLHRHYIQKVSVARSAFKKENNRNTLQDYLNSVIDLELFETTMAGS